MSKEYPYEVQQLIGTLISLMNDKNDTIANVAFDLLYKWDTNRNKNEKH